ncbi:MAG: molybdopterin-dependent oxidoreductase [Desulfofustis sp.]
MTRIEPLAIDDNDYKSWVISTADREYTPPRKVTVPPFVYTERNRLYSENRIKYPMKRVDFDPHGERNPENRGKSGYERISWDDAVDIVAGEIQRIGKEHGPSAVTGMTSSHHNWGIVGYKMGPFSRFMEMIDYTPILDNPDSWEGWHWGATHTYGFFWRVGMPEQYDLLEDALKHTEFIVFWSNDPDSTRGIYTGQESVIWRQWLKEKGIESVFIDPFYNYTNAAMDGKWIPVKPGTDTCLAMAIAYVWVEEDTYDKEYVETRTVGFDEFKPYLLGETDGVPKTPEWAEEESGVPARTIRSLARQWASKVTALSAGSRGGEGGACRQAYATEWARMMVLLQAMQGLGHDGAAAGHAGIRKAWGKHLGNNHGGADKYHPLVPWLWRPARADGALAGG